tara:strand:- start:638 stop:817 length:180 start_codon:yes stop_codon:yes gene_type:complete
MNTLPMEIESHLMDLGILMPSSFEQLEATCGQYDEEYFTAVFSKGYFNDPRDRNGEVPW